MFGFVRSLFGCAHRRCTFPITQSKGSDAAAGQDAEERVQRTTYVVCLDCGKEFFYDWQRMKLGRRLRTAA
jgi:hypothetical protein